MLLREDTKSTQKLTDKCWCKQDIAPSVIKLSQITLRIHIYLLSLIFSCLA